MPFETLDQARFTDASEGTGVDTFKPSVYTFCLLLSYVAEPSKNPQPDGK